MSGLSDLSDDDLKRLYSQQSAPQTNPLSSMSDDDLKALYARQQPAPASENASPSLWNRITSALSTPQAQKDAFNARDPRLAQAAQWQGTTPEALGRQNEASAGEFLKGVPVASAAVPQTPDMTKYEQEHPTGAAVWKGAGRLAALAPVMAAAPEVLGAGAGQGLIARTLAGAGSNAAVEGGDTYANTGDVDKSLEAAKKAAITAGIATPAMSAAGAVIAPTLQQGAKYLLDKGVRLTPGQMLGGLPQRIESGSESVPIMGQGIRAARERSIEDFNRAAANDALAPINKTLPQDVGSGYDAREFVRKSIGDTYDAAFNGAKMTPTPQLAQDVLGAAKKAAQDRLLPPDLQKRLGQVVQTQIAGKFNQAGGTLSGDAIKNVDSELGRFAAEYGQDPSVDTRALGAAIKDVQGAFRTHFAAQNPEAAATVATADKAWAHYVRLRQAGSSTAVQGAEGAFSPTQLQMAVKSQDKTLGKRAMSEGDALYQELAQYGKTILPSKVADSGTPERTALMHMIGVGGAGGAAATGNLMPLALAIGGTAVGRAAYSQPAQAMIRAAMNAGPGRQAAADIVRRYGPLAAAMTTSNVNH